MRRAVPRRRPRRGFTVISMLVAVILLAVGLLSLARSSGQSVTLQMMSQNRTNAISIARSHLEHIRTRNPWVVQSEPAVAVDADGQTSAGGAYKRTVDVQVVRQNLLRIDVKVTYPRGAQPVILSTSLFRGNGLVGP
jgi:type IV pilus assembly protein PilV